MSKSIRSRFVFIIALIRSFVNDVIRKQKPEAKSVPPEGVYRQGNYPAPKPLWRTWWEEKSPSLKLFWRKAFRISKRSFFLVLALSLLSGVVYGLYYLGRTTSKEVEAVVTRVSWSCNGYVEVVVGDNKQYYRSKPTWGEGSVAKCPPGPLADWRHEENAAPRYTMTLRVDLTYPHGEYANETTRFNFDNPIGDNPSFTLGNSNIKPGTHWIMKKTRQSFPIVRKKTEWVRQLPQPVKALE